MSNRKTAAAKLHGYRSDKNKQLRRSSWMARSPGSVPKSVNSNNRFR